MYVSYLITKYSRAAQRFLKICVLVEYATSLTKAMNLVTGEHKMKTFALELI